MTERTRRATHAGSWYSSDPIKLGRELDQWLSAVEDPTPSSACRAIIAPHAGYVYSGATAAYAYRTVDPGAIRKVFILGPSHHYHLNGCALSDCDKYATPLGDLTLDRAVIKELHETGEFETMSLKVDEAEHSIEMHLPFIRRHFQKQDITIIPILIGSISTAKERDFGRILGPYLDDPSNLFIISTDFAHWGSRFGYTYYQPGSAANGSSIDLRSVLDRSWPIHAAIEELDRSGMRAIAFDNRSPSGSPPSAAHQRFADYLVKTKNTICGRHPIGVLLGALASLEMEKRWTNARLDWIKYAQSGQCEKYSDSSVSYASGRVIVP